MNVNVEDDDFLFCFENSLYGIFSDVRVDVINLLKFVFKVVYEKLFK